MDLLTHATVCAECARALSTLPAAGVHCLSCLKARRFLLYLCDRQGALDLHWIYKGGFDNLSSLAKTPPGLHPVEFVGWLALLPGAYPGDYYAAHITAQVPFSMGIPTASTRF